MEKIILPKEDVNSEKAKLWKWNFEERDKVKKGDILCSFETTKAIFDLESPGDGYLLIKTQTGEEERFGEPVGYLFDTLDELEIFKEKFKNEKQSQINENTKIDIRPTKKAQQLADQYGVDLQKTGLTGLIKASDVSEIIGNSNNVNESDMLILKTGELPEGNKKILVLGGGFGAMQIIDILLHSNDNSVVGFVDDDETLKETNIFNVPYRGKFEEVKTLFNKGVFTHAIISISTNNQIRKEWYDFCKKMNIPFINAICPSVRINRNAVIGEGNVFCSNSHVGVCSKIGNNNFISSNSTIEHHNVIGDHNTTGPGFQTSSRVKVGDSIKFGMNVNIQPGIAIGGNSMISSGAIIIKNIPEKSFYRLIPNFKLETLK